MGLLAAGLAHDLNNMLGGIVTTAELLAARAGARAGAAEDRRDLGAILAQAVRASDLVRQILAFSRQELLNPGPAELTALLQRMAPVLGALAGRQVRLELVSGRPARVRVDPSALERVVVNLVLNARNAILEAPPGGRAGLIRVQADRIGPAARPEAARGFMPAVPYGRLSVEDDGPGVAPGIAGRIFEPYFTTRAEGQGLGLSTAYGLAKQSGGFLLLEQGQLGGARFSLYLPEDARVAGGAARIAQGRLLLLAEDELLLRMSVARGLERLGWRVRQAADGEAALALLEAEPPAVLVSDIRMPGMDGIALTRAARALHPGLPVLLTSGYADEAARAAVPELAVAWLPKPYTLKTLGERLREMLGAGSGIRA